MNEDLSKFIAWAEQQYENHRVVADELVDGLADARNRAAFLVASGDDLIGETVKADLFLWLTTWEGTMYELHRRATSILAVLCLNVLNPTCGSLVLYKQAQVWTHLKNYLEATFPEQIYK